MWRTLSMTSFSRATKVILVCLLLVHVLLILLVPKHLWKRNLTDTGLHVNSPGSNSVGSNLSILVQDFGSPNATDVDQNLTSADVSGYPNCSLWNTTVVTVTPICIRDTAAFGGRHPQTKQKSPLVVMMTTMKNAKNRRCIHESVIKLWSSLGPDVKPVLFVSVPVKDEFLVTLACASGFDVYVAPLCDDHGLPVLRSMFAVTQNVYPDSVFQGFANGDIGFDKSLLDTLNLLKLYKSDLAGFLAIGRRMDIKLPPDRKVESFQDLHQLSRTNGTKAFVVAEDFFITFTHGFPWHTIPKVVVGRRAYDNYIVSFANAKGMSTVDVSDTLLAAHLRSNEYYNNSHRSPGRDVNESLVGRFDMTRGLISCSKFRTLNDAESGGLKLARVRSPGFCGQTHWVKWKKNFEEIMGSQVLEDMPKH